MSHEDPSAWPTYNINCRTEAESASPIRLETRGGGAEKQVWRMQLKSLLTYCIDRNILMGRIIAEDNY